MAPTNLLLATETGEVRRIKLRNKIQESTKTTELKSLKEDSGMNIVGRFRIEIGDLLGKVTLK